MEGWNDPGLRLPNGLPEGLHKFAVRVHGSGSGSSLEQRIIELRVARSVVIGIDLGTTYSCLAFVDEHGVVHPIPLGTDHICMPMSFGFRRPDAAGQVPIQLGMEAKAGAMLDPHNTIFDLKRIIGRRPGDSVVAEFKRKMPFPVVDCRPELPHDSSCLIINVSRSDFPLLSGSRPGQEDGVLRLLPEEIVALAMLQMKKAAETFLGHPVDDCVITVPAQFNNGQSKATMDGTQSGVVGS